MTERNSTASATQKPVGLVAMFAKRRSTNPGDFSFSIVLRLIYNWVLKALETATSLGANGREISIMTFTQASRDPHGMEA